MTKNQKTAGSKKFVATLPYLTALSDEEINQMEIEFSLRDLAPCLQDDQAERFTDWLAELQNHYLDRMTDNYHCLAVESSWRKLSANELAILQMFSMMDDPFTGTGNSPYPYTGDDLWDMEDPDFDIRDDCQINGYQASMYWDDDGLDMLQSMLAFEESFCPEQAIIRKIPLKGLKQGHRKELTREYAVP
jgi:hypothetical protein